MIIIFYIYKLHMFRKHVGNCPEKDRLSFSPEDVCITSVHLSTASPFLDPLDFIL